MIIFGCDDDDNIGKDNDYDNVDWSLYHGIPPDHPRRKHRDSDETFDDGGDKDIDDFDRFRLRCSRRE